MDRRHFLAGLGATLLASAGPVAARTNGEVVIDRIRAQLRSQGYTRISLERTLLGRVRILATGPGSRREIIVDPRTGEILRDLWRAMDASTSQSAGDDLLDGSSSSDDNHDDDDKDDDGSDDSGHDSGHGDDS